MDALSLSSNIVRRGAVYYIRVRVPSDLLDYYAPKKEITYSLKTKDPREAKRKGNLERVKIDQQFAEARRNGQMTAATAQGQTTPPLRLPKVPCSSRLLSLNGFLSFTCTTPLRMMKHPALSQSLLKLSNGNANRHRKGKT